MSEQHIYAHTTSVENLRKLLDSGVIQSLRHTSLQTPDAEVSVEPLPLPLRMTMSADKAYNLLKHTKEPDKVFLTKDGYLPNYGEAVITKQLGNSTKQHESWNTIPEEYTTRRKLSLRHNAQIYVPDDKLDELQNNYRGFKFRPKSELNLKEYGLTDRWKAFLTKLRNKFTKEASEDSKYKRLFGRNAQLVGSEALGINLPDSSDTDVFVPYKRKSYFDRAQQRIVERYPDLHLNRVSQKRLDKKTFTGKVNNQPLDVVLAHGPRAERFREAFQKALASLTPERKAEIRRRKAELKNSWFFPETRYKWYKDDIARELGLKEAYF